MIECFNRQGWPITGQEWAKLIAVPDYQRLALGSPRPGVEVSTVWLGLNHNWHDGPPLIFETMIFGLPDEGQPCWRWPTEAAALAGHDRIMALVKDTLKGWEP